MWLEPIAYEPAPIVEAAPEPIPEPVPEPVFEEVIEPEPVRAPVRESIYRRRPVNYHGEMQQSAVLVSLDDILHVDLEDEHF